MASNKAHLYTHRRFLDADIDFIDLAVSNLYVIFFGEGSFILDWAVN